MSTQIRRVSKSSQAKPLQQGELDRVSVRFYILLIQLLYGLCATFPWSSCDLIHVTVMCDTLLHLALLSYVVSPNMKRKEKKYEY